jgi:hypothetical protein
MSSDYGNASGGFFDTIMGGSGGGGGKFGAERWG